MGLTHVTVSVNNLRNDGKKFESQFLVDTGAIDCLVPTDALIEAGVEIEGKDVYELLKNDTYVVIMNHNTQSLRGFLKLLNL